MKALCLCPAPLRDTSSSTRRFHCVRCDGVTPSGRRLSLEETARLIGQAHSLLDRILTDLVYATEATYGLQSPPDTEGGRPSGHSDPTLRAVTSRRADAAMLVALSAQWVKQATGWLLNADEAAGLALLATDTPRGPADHVKAPYHEPIPPGRTDLHTAHDAKAKRSGRGEL